MNQSKSLKRLLAEANELANLRTADETGIALDEALNDLIEAQERANESRFVRFRYAAISRADFLEQIERAYLDSAEQRCLVALKVCAPHGGISDEELSALAEEYPEILALLAREGYPVQEGEREEPLTAVCKREGRAEWKPVKFAGVDEAWSGEVPQRLRWITVKTYSIA